MGLFYSILSYLYPNIQQVKLSQNKIIVSTTKLIKYIKIRQEKLQLQTKKLQAQLLNMMKSPTNIRSVQGQNAIIQSILLNTQLFVAYQEIILCANTIKTQAKTLESDPSKISNRCFNSICSVVYCYNQMHLQDCIQLNQFIPEPYPSIKKSYLTDSLQIFMRHQKPNQYEINMYVLQMCARNNLLLQNVNEAGHHFVLNPKLIVKRPDQTETKSSSFFAVEFDDVQQMQKQYKQMMEKNVEGGYYGDNCYNSNNIKKQELQMINYQNNYENKNKKDDDGDFAL